MAGGNTGDWPVPHFFNGWMCTIRYKRMLCQWAVSGCDERVHAFVFEVEGYDRPWFLVTTALDLSGEQVAEAFAARFRQEDGFRDHKQRMGMEEYRAWTKEPVLRTFQVPMAAMTLLRLMPFRLDVAWQPVEKVAPAPRGRRETPIGPRKTTSPTGGRRRYIEFFNSLLGRGGLWAAAGMESTETPSVDPRPAATLSASPHEVFETLVAPGRDRKSPPDQDVRPKIARNRRMKQ